MGTDHEIAVRINGGMQTGRVEERLLLADFLRSECGLTGTHLGCEHGVCGACTVLVDGAPVRSCLMFAVQTDGKDVRTVESLANADGSLNALQLAFRRHHALQCGFCTPGVLMTLTALLQSEGRVTEALIRDHLSGHLCRCTGYQGMVDAAIDVFESRNNEEHL
jgi:carbon-monoxide dehydrogenase small subunit